MNTNLPLFTIEQTVKTYHYLFKPNPEFGMDCFADDFHAKEVVLLDDVRGDSQGIPIHFNYYALFLRMQGDTKRTINQFDYLIKPQSLQLVNPGAIYSFKDLTNTSRTYVLLFDREFIEKDNLSPDVQKPLLEFHQKHQRDVLLDMTQFAQVVSIYEQLSSELKERRDDYKTVVKMLINQLLYILKREKLDSGIKQYHTRAEQISAEFLVLIEEHFWQKKSVNGYAKMLGVTPKHLSETIKSTLHRSALSFIHVRIIKEMQYLLCFSDMPIKQIASVLNFETLSLMGRFFKRYEGISPTEYRLSHKNRIKTFDK